MICQAPIQQARSGGLDTIRGHIMKKATKGALAAVAGGSLLLGGAGTLAYWTDTSTVAGGSITGGTLSLVDPTCTWKLEHTGGTTIDPILPAAIRLVPGDTATETCTSTITATGQNLKATLGVTGGTDANGNPLASAITPVASYKVGTVDTQAAITSADDGKTLTATIVLAFPFGATADNTTNGGLTETVTSYVITATQVDDIS